MRVPYLILARYAEFGPDGRLNLIGGDQNQYIADAYPYIHPSLIAATRISLDHEDSKQEHSFISDIIDEETGDIIAEGLSGTIPPLPMPAEAAFVGTGMILAFRDSIFPRQGRYKVRLHIDQQVMAETAFRIAPVSYYQGLMRGGQLIVRGESDGSSDRPTDQ